MRFLLTGGILAALAVGSVSFARADDDTPHRTINVHNHGAKCNGVHDDTAAFRQAIAKAPVGGAILVPPGRCVVSDTLVIATTNAVSITGAGRASQIFQRSNKTLFDFQGVNALTVSELFLGSAATAPGTALIKLTNSHHMRIDNVSMLGGYYGLHLKGSLVNTIIDLRSGTNFASTFFAAASANQYWVFAERFNGFAANANTFVAPVLEGGVNGIWVQDPPAPSCPGCARAGEGSITITGGSIEGVSQTALTLERTFLPSSVTGVHFEANGTDVLINESANIRLTAILALGGPGGSGTNGIRVQGVYTRNVQISDSIVQKIVTDTTVKRFQLQNITTDLQCTSASGVTPSAPWDSSVIYTNVGLNCS